MQTNKLSFELGTKRSLLLVIETPYLIILNSILVYFGAGMITGGLDIHSYQVSWNVTPVVEL